MFRPLNAMDSLLPISALIPTRNRSTALTRTLQSLAQQSVQPAEAIIIDGSDDGATQALCQHPVAGLATSLDCRPAKQLGAALQRNQGIAHATQNAIWLLDDDVLLEPECLARLWQALQSDSNLGGVNATITNQQYSPPGRASRWLFRFLNGRWEPSYAGKCIGPALNLLPEDRPDLPEVVPVEWLNTTCTLYRREVLPEPLFPECFQGYSLLEDVTLSLTVGKRWKLANARTARIFHDSQPGDHKDDPRTLAWMDLVNRYYVMTAVLERTRLLDYLKLGVQQLFDIVAVSAARRDWRFTQRFLQGKLRGIRDLVSSDC